MDSPNYLTFDSSPTSERSLEDNVIEEVTESFPVLIFATERVNVIFPGVELSNVKSVKKIILLSFVVNLIECGTSFSLL